MFLLLAGSFRRLALCLSARLRSLPAALVLAFLGRLKRPLAGPLQSPPASILAADSVAAVRVRRCSRCWPETPRCLTRAAASREAPAAEGELRADITSMIAGDRLRLGHAFTLEEIRESHRDPYGDGRPLSPSEYDQFLK